MRECATHHHACDCREALFEQIRSKGERLEAALETALTVLEQIATTPRNRGAKRSASATVAFLRTQLDARHNAKVEADGAASCAGRASNDGLGTAVPSAPTFEGENRGT